MSQAVVNAVLRAHDGRFVGDGVHATDLEKMLGQIHNWSDWFGVWTTMAKRYEDLGDEAMTAGAMLTAGEFYWLACLYQHYAQFLWFHEPERRFQGQQRKVQLYDKAAPLLRPSGQRVEVVHGPWRIPGFLRLPHRMGPSPTVVLLGGLESTKEESRRFEELCTERGMATMAFDGPGQGEMFSQVRFRPDIEAFTSAVIDYLETRPEIDSRRIGILGRSLGGYLAVRSAAYDHRIRACVAWGALNNLRHWDRIPELTRAGFAYIAGLRMDEAKEFYGEGVTLQGIAEQVACPLYVLHGAMDTVLPGDHVEKLRAATRHVPQTFVIEPEGNHCCHNLYPIVRPRMADWLADTLGVMVESS